MTLDKLRLLSTESFVVVLWVCANSCPLSQWCHLTISSSVICFSSSLQSFLAPGSFLKSWLSASGGQSIGASASVLPMNIQGWFPLGWTGLISLLSHGLFYLSLYISLCHFLQWEVRLFCKSPQSIILSPPEITCSLMPDCPADTFCSATGIIADLDHSIAFRHPAQSGAQETFGREMLSDSTCPDSGVEWLLSCAVELKCPLCIGNLPGASEPSSHWEQLPAEPSGYTRKWVVCLCGSWLWGHESKSVSVIVSQRESSPGHLSWLGTAASCQAAWDYISKPL